METAYAVKLPYELNGLETFLKGAYANIQKSGVTFAASDREALSHFFYRGFRDKVKARAILRALKAGRAEGKGLDELIARGAKVYEIPQIAREDGEPIMPDDEKFHRTMILAEQIANSQGRDLSNCTNDEFKRYRKEAEGFVKLAMNYERENYLKQESGVKQKS